MTAEKKRLLDKINELIDRRKNDLLKQLPNIHEIVDGIIIRTFKDWSDCDENQTVKYKRIDNLSDTNEIIIFYFLPKDTVLEMKKRDYINCITCLSGEIELSVNGEVRKLSSYKKMCLANNEFSCKILENSYLVTTNTK